MRAGSASRRLPQTCMHHRSSRGVERAAAGRVELRRNERRVAGSTHQGQRDIDIPENVRRQRTDDLDDRIRPAREMCLTSTVLCDELTRGWPWCRLPPRSNPECGGKKDARHEAARAQRKSNAGEHQPESFVLPKHLCIGVRAPFRKKKRLAHCPHSKVRCKECEWPL